MLSAPLATIIFLLLSANGCWSGPMSSRETERLQYSYGIADRVTGLAFGIATFDRTFKVGSDIVIVTSLKNQVGTDAEIADGPISFSVIDINGREVKVERLLKTISNPYGFTGTIAPGSSVTRIEGVIINEPGLYKITATEHLFSPDRSKPVTDVTSSSIQITVVAEAH